MLIYVFFFQAEDGIRDKLVTGVQTCALPISRRQHVRRHRFPVAVAGGRARRREEGPRRRSDALGRRQALTAARPMRAARSEERRVGKECRSGGMAEQYKRKVIRVR